MKKSKKNKTMKNSVSNKYAGSVILLIVLTFGGYLIYDLLKKKSSGIVDTLTNKASNLSSSTSQNSTPVENKISAGGIRTQLNLNKFGMSVQQYQEANASLDNFNNADPKYIIEFNPHYKGIWNDKTGIIRDRISGKSYPKDADLELIKKYVGLFHYYVKYKGDYCYFPVSLIRESGFWTENSTSPNTSKLWGNR